jgi:hypothetical protein
VPDLKFALETAKEVIGEVPQELKANLEKSAGQSGSGHAGKLISSG